LSAWLTDTLQVRCDQHIRAAVANVRRTICDVQIKEEVVVKKVKKDEALANYKLQISNLLQTESRIRRLFRDIEQVMPLCDVCPMEPLVMCGAGESRVVGPR
jgi:hypothetical protein